MIRIIKFFQDPRRKEGDSLRQPLVVSNGKARILALMPQSFQHRFVEQEASSVR